MAKPTVLFVDDDPTAGELVRRLTETANFACEVFRDPASALRRFTEDGVDMIVTDLKMPGMSGLELLHAVREKDPDIPVVIITAFGSVDSAIEALRLGATDFLKKPFDPSELELLIERNIERRRLRQENRVLRRQLQDERARHGMIGDAEAMRRVYRLIAKVAEVHAPVVITGESGTGKELAARAIHDLGDPDRPFIVIDCGSLADNLLESELFGHEKGAFTGAVSRKQGLLEAARGGTVFLDEICNISPAMQAKLLRVLQEGTITRVGGVAPIAIETRFITATNRDLAGMVEQGEFRHDLFHRLNVVNIRIPPLRERRDDIPLVTQHFVSDFAARYGRPVKGFTADAMQRLKQRDWPGNVRELRNLIERHVALADNEYMELDEDEDGSSLGGLDADRPDLATLERRYILKLLAEHQGNRERTAEALGINKSTLWRRLQQYGTDGG